MEPASCCGPSEPHAGGEETGPAESEEWPRGICTVRFLADVIFCGDTVAVNYIIEIEPGREVSVRTMIRGLDAYVRIDGAES